MRSFVFLLLFAALGSFQFGCGGGGVGGDFAGSSGEVPIPPATIPPVESPRSDPTPKPLSVTLAWDPHPDPFVDNFRLYVGFRSRAYSSRIDVGNVNIYKLEGLVSGKTYYFAVTATYKALLETDPVNAESELSDEVSYQVP
jgi:hypothetical protein